MRNFPKPGSSRRRRRKKGGGSDKPKQNGGPERELLDAEENAEGPDEAEVDAADDASEAE
jgi:hypothetical protein